MLTNRLQCFEAAVGRTLWRAQHKTANLGQIGNLYRFFTQPFYVMPPCAQRAAGRFRVQYPTFPAVAVRVMTPKQQAASS
uniref:Uncharacterized protein n=1 Tax=Anopheles arabiensis TaxID=7173 RepID=A0A182IFY8_ANOAR